VEKADLSKGHHNSKGKLKKAKQKKNAMHSLYLTLF